VLYRNGERKDIVCTMQELIPFAVRKRFPVYEPIEYETFAGMVIMQLSEEHLGLLLEDSPELLLFRLPERRVDPVLIVTHIIPHSYVYQLAMIPVGSIITQVNGKHVVTLDDLRAAIQQKKGDKWVSVMTKVGVLMVLSWDKIEKSDKEVERLIGKDYISI